MIDLDGLYVGKIRFFVMQNLCESHNPCDCEEMREQLQAQLMEWA